MGRVTTLHFTSTSLIISLQQHHTERVIPLRTNGRALHMPGCSVNRTGTLSFSNLHVHELSRSGSSPLFSSSHINSSNKQNVLNPLLDSETQQWNKSPLDFYMELEQMWPCFGFLVALRCLSDEHGSEMVTEAWNPTGLHRWDTNRNRGTEKKKEPNKERGKKKNNPSMLQSAILTRIREACPSQHKQIMEQNCRTKSSMSNAHTHYSDLAHTNMNFVTRWSLINISYANNFSYFFVFLKFILLLFWGPTYTHSRNS